MDRSRDLPLSVVQAIADVVGKSPVALHEPRFRGNEWAYLKECLDSTFVSSVGSFVDRFEADLAAYTGAGRAVAVVNGTAALHVALLLAGVQPGDHVLLPALTFIATANAVAYCQAVPHFVDSETRSLGMDALALREHLRASTEMRAGQCIHRASGQVIRAMVPMHTFGHPADMTALLAVAHDFGIAVVEDAAESLGSSIGGRHTGTFGLLGTLSFNGNKTITTGGGGAILTNDPALGARAKHLTTTAKQPHKWAFFHDEVGYNFRMPNLNAAMGCAQLEQLPGFLAAKRELTQRYVAAFAGMAGARLFTERAGTRANYWLQTLILDADQAHLRDAVLTATNAAGQMTRPVWELLTSLPMYRGNPAMDASVARDLAARIVNLPSSPQIVTGAV